MTLEQLQTLVIICAVAIVVLAAGLIIGYFRLTSYLLAFIRETRSRRAGGENDLTPRTAPISADDGAELVAAITAAITVYYEAESAYTADGRGTETEGGRAPRTLFQIKKINKI
ncbi:MAG: hypothetical protein LBS99_00690 [Clostridiales bacterium]|nr:hypothetical protein [Clostridiales bacterium]